MTYHPTHPVNTEVLIVQDCRRNTPLDTTGMRGTLEGYESASQIEYDDGSVEKVDTARIRLSNGDLIYGYQCWWEVKDETGEIYWSLPLV